ncbi:MAG: septum formation inhibitor Maf [Deltaproteobacteria bacterium]|nr:septum formation inhibitor Maf [Deltaproteobacteria bacterium]
MKVNVHRPLCLASGSPARKKLLEEAGLSFHVCVTGVDETELPGESVQDYVVRLATEKAHAALKKHGDALVIGVDTTVLFQGKIIGKPDDAAHAREMLTLLSGEWHDVITGLAVGDVHHLKAVVATTRVKMRALSTAELDAYVATGEPLGKAGAYAIQGLGKNLVEKIEGSYTNVVGLPMEALEDLLRRLHVLSSSPV